MGAILEAYITNLGKYAEGQLVGETLKFPTTTEEVQSLLKRIGVDGVRYEEIFITSFDSDVLGLHEHLGEYENIDELNYLAALLSDMDQSDLEKFEAVIDAGEYTGSVKDLINLTQNLDCFEFYSGITGYSDPIRTLCMVGVTGFSLGLKNSPPDCFLRAAARRPVQTLVPLVTKRTPSLSWRSFWSE